MTGRGFRQTDQIGQELIGPFRPGGQLPPESEADIDPATFSDPGLDEGPQLLPGIVRERVDHRDEVHVSGILLAKEVEPALLYPTVPGRLPDLVWRIEHGLTYRY